MATLSDIIIEDSTDWQSINTLTSTSVGTNLLLQNKCTNWLILKSATSQPDSTDFDGNYVTTLYQPESSKEVESGSNEVWVRAAKGSGRLRIAVETL